MKASWLLRQMRSRSSVRSSTRCSRVALSRRSASPARCNSVMSAFMPTHSRTVPSALRSGTARALVMRQVPLAAWRSRYSAV